MSKKTSIGGQALIEGIMMKGPQKTCIAVRMPDGDIDISFTEGKRLKDKFSFFGLPVIRGSVSLVESMIEGYKALMISADKSGFTELEDKKEKSEVSEKEEENAVTEKESTDAGKESTAAEEKEKTENEKKKNDTLLNVVMIFASVLGVGLAVVLFMLLPRLAVQGLRALFDTQFTPVVRSSIEQLIKLAIFVVYVWAVSCTKDIKRVFMYHGAEHKTIFCYEKGLPLTVENVRNQRRFHPRCGTSFMILMILVSIVFSTLIQIIFPGVYNIYWLWIVVKILLVPIVCGAGYELLKVCGRHDNVLTKIIAAPGLWLQRITTKEPEDSMIEVAIASVNEVIPENPDEDRW